MIHELRLFCVALQFLTRAPVPRWVGFDPLWLQSCLRYFPLVGVGVGLWAAGMLWLALLLWPPLVAAAVSTIATVWLTGAFHEDGLADTCDALGGAVSRERALAIMKDSRIGSYGAVALVLALVLKVAVVAALVTGVGPSGGPLTAAVALVWSHTVSRGAPLWLMARLSYAGDVELAKARPLAMQITRAGMAVGLAWVALMSAVALAVMPAAARTPGVALAVALVACSLATAWCERWLRRRLGGYTGDTLGATQQIVELAGLLAWSAVLGFGRP